MLHFIFDIGGSISSERTTINSGDKIPSNAAVAAQLAFMFGGAPDSKKSEPETAPAPAQATTPAPAQPAVKADDQPVSSQKVLEVREAAEKAQKALDAESKKTP